MQVSRATAIAQGESLRQHRDEFVKRFAGQVAKRIRAAHQGKKCILRIFLIGNLGHDLLRQDIERLLGHDDAVEFAAAHGVEDGGAFDQVVARQGKQAALGRAADKVSRTPDALQKCRNGLGRSNLTDQVNFPDVDAQLHARGGHECAKLPVFQALFGIVPLLLAQAPMVRADGLFAEPFLEMVGKALGEAARIHEDQRRGMLQDALLEDIVNFLPLVVGQDRAEGRRRNLDAQVEVAAVAGVDDAAEGLPVGRDLCIADEEAGDQVNGFLGGGEADALDGPTDEIAQPFDADGKMRTAFAADHGMDFVHDQGAGAGEHLASAGACEQEVKAFGRGDKDMRRGAGHGRALIRGGVARADACADAMRGQAHGFQLMVDAVERAVQIPVNVIAQRLERRDIDHVGAVFEPAFKAELDEFVDGGEEGSQGLARARGRGDEGMLMGLDGRPSAKLNVGRGFECGFEPLARGGMEVAEGHFYSRPCWANLGKMRGSWHLSALGPILQNPHPKYIIPLPAIPTTVPAHGNNSRMFSVDKKSRRPIIRLHSFRIPQQNRVAMDPVLAFEVSAAEVHVKAAIRIQVQGPPRHGSIRKCAEDRGFGCATRQAEEDCKDQKVLLEGSEGIHGNQIRGKVWVFQWGGRIGLAQALIRFIFTTCNEALEASPQNHLDFALWVGNHFSSL